MSQETITIPKSEFERLRKIDSNLGLMLELLGKRRDEVLKHYRRPHPRIQYADDIITVLEGLLT